MPVPVTQLAAITMRHARKACQRVEEADITNPDLTRGRLVGLITNVVGNLDTLIRVTEAQIEIEARLGAQLEELRAENKRLAEAADQHSA